MGAIFSRGKGQGQGRPHLDDGGIDSRCVIQKLQQFPHDIVPLVKMNNIINQCKVEAEEEDEMMGEMMGEMMEEKIMEEKTIEGFGNISNQNIWIFVILIIVVLWYWYTKNKL